MREAFSRGFKLRQILLVQHDERCDLGGIAGDQAHVEKGFAEGGAGCDDDNGLIDIGGERFLPPRVGTEQHIAALVNRINPRVAGAGDADLDFVATRDILLFAFAHADELCAVFQFSQIFATEVAGDECLHQRLNSASSFAAQMKSLRVMPPASWVEYATTHLL